MPDARSPAPISQQPGEHRVDWAAVTRAEAERERRVERERDVGRVVLGSGLATIVGGVALVLAAAGALEIVGIVVVVVGAVVAVRGNRRILHVERFRASGGDASAGSTYHTGGFGGGHGGHC